MDDGDGVNGAAAAFWSKPIWLVGFRPFFTLALIYGGLLPFIWALVFSGQLSWTLTVNPLAWHAHEMFFGFGWALLGGFLLTSSKNWVKVRGAHGALLGLFVVLWFLDRIDVYGGLEGMPLPLRWFFQGASVAGPGLYVMWTLVQGRKQDAFPDNFYFLFLLALILVAKFLLLNPDSFVIGREMTLGLFRLAFIVMFERTTTQFMKNSEGLSLIRNPVLDVAVKLSAAAAVFAVFLPSDGAGVLLLAAGLLQALRWVLWRPDIGFRRFGNAGMYVGMAALFLHFILEGVKALSGSTPALNSIHLFTMICMGSVGASMMVRISNGHTGRRAEFAPLDRLAISLIWAAAAIRLLCPLWAPDLYQNWIYLAAISWSSGFLILSWHLIPLLFQARVDGRVH